MLELFELAAERIDEGEVFRREDVLAAEGDNDDLIAAELIEEAIVVADVGLEEVGLDTVVEADVGGEVAQERAGRGKRDQDQGSMREDRAKQAFIHGGRHVLNSLLHSRTLFRSYFDNTVENLFLSRAAGFGNRIEAAARRHIPGALRRRRAAAPFRARVKKSYGVANNTDCEEPPCCKK